MLSQARVAVRKAALKEKLRGEQPSAIALVSFRPWLAGVEQPRTASGLNQPIGVTVDPAAGALYYTDPFLLLSSVYRAELDGSNPRRMLLGGTPLGIMYAAGRSGGAVAH